MCEKKAILYKFQEKQGVFTMFLNASFYIEVFWLF